MSKPNIHVDVMNVTEYSSIDNIRLSDERLAFESLEMQTFDEAEYEELSKWVAESEKFKEMENVGDEVKEIVRKHKETSTFSRVEIHVDIISNERLFFLGMRNVENIKEQPFVRISVFQY